MREQWPSGVADVRWRRVLIGESKMDFSKNDNELLNPGQSIWKWKTVEDLVRERGGNV